MSRSESWKTWEGRTVGKFPLRRWLGGSDHSAVFLTDRSGEDSEKTAIKLIATDADHADRLLSRLQGAAKISHPHLVRIFDAGRSQIDGAPFVYVITEFAEEDLSQILPQRALLADEVSDLLPPVLEALSFLHHKGLVHSRVKPSNLLAVGDQLKLSSDQIGSISELGQDRRRRDVYDAPETAAGIISAESDIWSVGATLVAAITQNVALAENAAPGKPGLPDTIPEPFRGIARECLQLDPKRRCSLAQIQARLQPAGRSVPAPPLAAEAPPKPATHTRFSWRMLIPVAVLLIFALGWWFWKSASSSKPQESSNATSAQPPAAAAPPPFQAPAQTASADSKGSVAHQVVPDVPKNAMSTITGTIKVTVRVEVDSSGKVISEKLKNAGSSAYFARLALAAAHHWQFVPPVVHGEAAPSIWLLQFRFRRTSTQASSQRLSR